MIPPSANYSIYWNVLRATRREEVALAYFTKARWQHGEFCPYCGHKRIYHLKDGRTHKCAECKACFSITVRTIFEGTKLPVQTWMLAIAYLCDERGRVGSTELATRLGVSQKSAWYMLQRLRHAAQTLSFHRSPDELPTRGRQTVREDSGEARSSPSSRTRSKKGQISGDVSGRKNRVATPEPATKRQRRAQPSRNFSLVYSDDETENAAVESVFQKLHAARKLAGGWGHPSDAARIETMLKPLVAEGYRIDSESSYEWALRRGWEEDSARELALIVEKLGRMRI